MLECIMSRKRNDKSERAKAKKRNFICKKGREKRTIKVRSMAQGGKREWQTGAKFFDLLRREGDEVWRRKT